MTSSICLNPRTCGKRSLGRRGRGRCGGPLRTPAKAMTLPDQEGPRLSTKSSGVMLYGLLAASPAVIRMSAVEDGMWSSIGVVTSAGLWNQQK